MEVTVDLDEVKEFIESDNFINFLLSNTVNINVAVFILQELEKAIDRYKEESEELENV